MLEKNVENIYTKKELGGTRLLKHLSRKDIEAIAERIVTAYKQLPEIKNTNIYRIEPELLLTKLLGLKIEYQHLSLDGSILGMTSFNEIGVKVFDETDDDTYFFLDGKTVLVEKDLQQNTAQRGRFNFTVMHEGSHQIYKMLYSKEYGVNAVSEVQFYKVNSENRKPIFDWEEWQANTLASAILLHKDLIVQGMFLFGLGTKIDCLSKTYTPLIYDKFATLADFLGASKTALAIRMQQLGFLEKGNYNKQYNHISIYPEASE